MGVIPAAMEYQQRTENDLSKVESTKNDKFDADLADGDAEYVAVSPGGGWLVKYSNGGVRLSMTGAFSSNFNKLASKYMQTRGSKSYQLHYSPISNAFLEPKM